MNFSYTTLVRRWLTYLTLVVGAAIILGDFISRWLGHASIQTTLVYLEWVPDPAGSLASVP